MHEQDFMQGPLSGKKDRKRSPAPGHVEKACFGHRSAKTLIPR